MKTETIDRHPRDAAKPDPTYSHPHLAPGWARLKEEYGADQPWQYSPKMEGLWSNYDYLPESALPRTRTIFEPGDPVDVEWCGEWHRGKVEEVHLDSATVRTSPGRTITNRFGCIRPIPAEPAAPEPVAEPKHGDRRERKAMEPRGWKPSPDYVPSMGDFPLAWAALVSPSAWDFSGWQVLTCSKQGYESAWHFLPLSEPEIPVADRREWWKDAPAEKAEEPTPAQGPSLPRFESAEEIEWALKGAWAVVRMTEERKVSDFADPLGAVQRYTAIKARIAELERALSDLAATGAGEGA